MKNLDEHNTEAMEEYWKACKREEERRTGVACPACKAELIFSDNDLLPSIPPKRNVQCPQCGYHGYMIV